MAVKNLSKWEHFLAALGKKVEPKKNNTVLKWLALGLPAAGIAGAAAANPQATSQFAYRVGNTAVDLGNRAISEAKKLPSVLSNAANAAKDSWANADVNKLNVPGLSLDSEALKKYFSISAWTNDGILKGQNGNGGK